MILRWIVGVPSGIYLLWFAREAVGGNLMPGHYGFHIRAVVALACVAFMASALFSGARDDGRGFIETHAGRFILFAFCASVPLYHALQGLAMLYYPPLSPLAFVLLLLTSWILLGLIGGLIGLAIIGYVQRFLRRRRRKAGRVRSATEASRHQ